MAANYSTNPANPVNQSGGQPPGAIASQPEVAPQPMQQGQMKSIRDYLAASRAGGQVPSFTNIPGGAGYQMPAEAPPQQAISEAPASEYEKVPFTQRMSRSPYERAEERIQDMMPIMWNQMFPGYQPGAMLKPEEMESWKGAVAKVTSSLVEQYDKQYGEFRKYEMNNARARDDERRYWQGQYFKASQQGQMPLNEDGTPIGERDFIEQRMAVADEIGFKKSQDKVDMAGAISEQAGEIDGDMRFTQTQVAQAFKNNPELRNAVQLQAKTFISDAFGRQLTDEEFSAVVRDPQYSQLVDEATFDALKYYQDEVQLTIEGK